RRECRADTELVALYRPVLEVLVRLQVDAAAGYDPHTGHFHGSYDAGLMAVEEGRYFAEEFAAGLCGLPVPAAYFDQVERLAAEGARAPAGFLLHRDFQSRNIHLTTAGPAVIDFQGCRPGPLAYDVAALLLDPYAALPAPARECLLAEYRALLGGRGVAPDDFDAGWFAVGAFRLLQALGAFAKLGGRLGKPGFLEHATTGLEHLWAHLGERGRRRYPAVAALVAAARDAWVVSPRRP
ncbi:MAG TPA: phosphotransferase, partial [Deferrisomatales bacterium]|nr:phosphotransferase [Deferrisomatales bacterium]